ncbi:MAG: hypothetical protein HYZ28_15450 [Myxococcales bacterium]|nr:hypothetical protein [Myxococcales bacterium]
MTVERSSEGTPTLTLAGSLDEHCNLGADVAEPPAGAVLNLAGIRRINSVGVLHWLKWIKALTEVKEIWVDAVPYNLVVQANHLVDFFGKAKVRSCLVPYYCPRCKTNVEREVKVEEVGPSQAPVKRCEKCNTEMDFDEVDEYFAFLRRDDALK